MKSAYIHIPFCKSICSYCDFCKVFYNEKIVDKYLVSLEREIDSIYNNEELETIYIGGGTPSSLNFRQLYKLFDIIKKLRKSNKMEFTIECNFDSVTEEKLKIFRENGVNRLSFGLESINKRNLDILGRDENKLKVINTIKLCRKLGFNNINIDLMYAIPNEKLEDLEEDIDFILSLDVEHISTYSLIIEEHTKLYIDKTNYVSEDLDYEMYKLICNKLKNNNFIHYEISNFSKNGYFSRHNMCYWKNKEYYGFGVGSASYIMDERITNTRSITKYLENNVKTSIEKLSIDDKISYEMILGLRLIEGISKDDFIKKYRVDIRDVFDIDSLIKKDLLKENSTNIYINEDKLYISNEILINFVKE